MAATAEQRSLLRRSCLATEKDCTANRCYTSRAAHATADASITDQLCIILRHSDKKTTCQQQMSCNFLTWKLA